MYDTNILISFWREEKRNIHGNTTILNIIEFPKALLMKNLVVIYPNPDDLNLALKISKDLMKRGTPVDCVNIILAAIALNRDLIVVTKDRDFEFIKKVRPRLKVKVIKEEPN